MTYRAGTYVVDVHEGKLAQVVGSCGDLVEVREPYGSSRWEASASALRLATREERQAAGLRPYQSGCDECAELEAAGQTAAAMQDWPRSRNATAARYTHWIAVHSASAPRRSN
ncbi:hypothetical protein GCM10010357_20140 [Streptomyces luteireticuli]|uniref:Uncharacterized protein n=1 Tax=Streptomyces luteireticuli TaxID=173858 RepID=A0ABP3IGG8_9ACTN